MTTDIYVVHQSYGRMPKGGKSVPVHMVVTPGGQRKMFFHDEIESYLRGKKWRFAK